MKERVLKREIATATEIRSPWGSGVVSSGLTPRRLAVLLQQAADGDLQAYLTLAEEMEERDPHYASVLRTRKLAVSGLPVQVLAASDSAEDAAKAAFIEALTQAPEFSELVDDLLDGLGKGYSVCEMLWQTHQTPWQPIAYTWRDPRYFVVPRDHPYQLHLLDKKDLVNGVPLPPHKFIIHRPKLKSGLPHRGGLARLVAFSYVCKLYGLKDWLSFLEVYGMPLRLGKYGSAASDEDRQVLKQAVSNIGSDAAAILPESMQIEFQQVAQSSNSESFLHLVEWIDKQVAKAVLGQTATTEGTPGKLGADNAQAEVRQDLIAADAKQLAQTLNRDLVKTVIDINYGPQKAYPRIVIALPEEDDLALLADNLAKLVPLGLQVSAQEVRQKLGLSTPDKEAEILQAPSQSMPTFEQGNNQQQTQASVAMNRDDAELTNLLLGDLEPVTTDLLHPLQQEVNKAASYDDWIASLPDVLQQMDTETLQNILAKAGLMAVAQGIEDK